MKRTASLDVSAGLSGLGSVEENSFRYHFWYPAVLPDSNMMLDGAAETLAQRGDAVK